MRFGGGVFFGHLLLRYYELVVGLKAVCRAGER